MEGMFESSEICVCRQIFSAIFVCHAQEFSFFSPSWCEFAHLYMSVPFLFVSQIIDSICTSIMPNIDSYKRTLNRKKYIWYCHLFFSESFDLPPFLFFSFSLSRNFIKPIECVRATVSFSNKKTFQRMWTNVHKEHTKPTAIKPLTERKKYCWTHLIFQIWTKKTGINF